MFVPTSFFGCCFGISFGCFLYIHFGCCFDIFLCAFGNDHANDGFGLLGLFLTSLHSPYHSVTFKFDLFGKRRFKSLASKKHRMESVCRSRKIGFRLFALPFPPLLHSAVSVSPPLLYLISINKSSAQTGYLFLQIAFGLGFGIGFACSVWTCSVVCTIIIAYFWDLSIPF